MKPPESSIDDERARDWRLPVVLSVGLLLTAVSGLAVMGLGDRPPAPAADLGTIAFVHASYEDRALGLDPSIRSVSPAGGPPTTLAGLPGSIHAAVRCCAPWNPEHDVLAGPAVQWSPDGDRIAFRLFHDEPGIYVMSRDGTGLGQLVRLLDDRFSGLPFSPAMDWSTDGTRIAFRYPYDHVRRSFVASAIHVVDTRDGVVTKLPGGGASRAIAWSPDGGTIGFVRTHADRTSGVYVVNVDGTAERRLDDPASGGNAEAMAWSPDGSRIAVYDSFDQTVGQPVLRVMGADGSEPRILKAWPDDGCCSRAGGDGAMAWSPDGSRIAMVQVDASGHPGILVVNADGSGDLVVSEGGYFDWSPNGSRLVVSDAGLSTASAGGDPTASYSIYVVNRDGTGRTRLADGEYPAWGPLPTP